MFRKLLGLTPSPPNSPSQPPQLPSKEVREDQDAINTRYEALEKTSTTKFGWDSKAYRFTNESLADFVNQDLHLRGPVLTITASGDPVCLFAGMGAQEIYSVDVSRYANAWAEYKLHGFLRMNFSKFQRTYADHEARWNTFPFEADVSMRAREIFSCVEKSPDRLIDSTNIFQNQGYAASTPKSAGYTDKQHFKKMQQQARKARVRFYPSDFTTFFDIEKIPENFFSLIYISNVLDHAKNLSTGDLHLHREALEPLISTLVDHLQENGQVLLNLQWGNRAREGTSEVFKSRGFQLDQLRKECSGCGHMYVAHR